jgi:hypothetical protein
MTQNNLTLHNSGIIVEDGQHWSNQCMFISIYQYLVEFLNFEISFSELQQIAGLGDDTRHSMFDIDDLRFVNAVQNVALCFDLNIHVYYVNNKGERRLSNFYHQFGNINSDVIVSIASYGCHFELIVCNDLQIDDRISPFQPNISLAHNYGVSIRDDYIDAIIMLKQDIAMCEANSISEQIKVVDQLISSTMADLKKNQDDIEYFQNSNIEEEDKFSAYEILLTVEKTLLLQLSSQEKLSLDFVKNGEESLSSKRKILEILTRELDE